jgi:hypothetical protein
MMYAKLRIPTGKHLWQVQPNIRANVNFTDIILSTRRKLTQLFAFFEGAAIVV